MRLLFFYIFISSSTGQWSLPITSGWIFASIKFFSKSFDAKKFLNIFLDHYVFTYSNPGAFHALESHSDSTIPIQVLISIISALKYNWLKYQLYRVLYRISKKNKILYNSRCGFMKLYQKLYSLENYKYWRMNYPVASYGVSRRS